MTTLQRIETDVIVVGGGGAALAAAGSAAALGRDVILLEKNPQLGGSTAWSVGSVTATCTPHQIKQGIKDNPAHHLEDLRLFAGPLAHRDNFELARVLTDNTPEMFRWLLSTGLEFIGPLPEPPHRLPRMHNVLPNSRAFPYLLGRHCRKLGVDIRLDTRAERLITDGNTGRVCGVAASTPDGVTYEFIAKSARAARGTAPRRQGVHDFRQHGGGAISAVAQFCFNRALGGLRLSRRLPPHAAGYFSRRGHARRAGGEHERTALCV